jgi:hypothetical protein
MGTLQGDLRPDKLLSIGQHYGLRTHLMDWSSDWEVALWFATHQWANGNYVQGGDAVIYQIDVQALGQAEIEANQALNLTTPSQMCRHVDIRDTPPILAPRALAQRGFSIAGLESPHFLQSLIRSKGLAVHVFPRGVIPSKLNCLTKVQLVPPLDQMSALFAEAGQQGALFQQAIS